MTKLKFVQGLPGGDSHYGEIIIFEQPKIVWDKLLSALEGSYSAKFLMPDNTTILIDPKTFLFWEAVMFHFQ